MAQAELNIAPGAHLTASSWSSQSVVIDARDAIPRNAVDGNAATAWRPDASDAGPRWVQLDFTRPWPMRYVWRRLVTRWVKPPSSYHWQVSRDGFHWHTLARRDAPTEVDAAVVNGTGSYLRLVVPRDETPELGEVEAFAASRGSGNLAPIALDLKGNVAELEWPGGTERNVFLYRLSRTATVGIGDSGTAGVTSIITEGPLRRYDDRVEHPTVSGIKFGYQWTVEAFGPDGVLIDAVTTPAQDVSSRSPNPYLFRGVVEGYYGPGYSDAEREDLVRFVGNRGGNYYLYGPKLDPFHRDRWREPYPVEYEDSLRRLVTIAGDHGVRFAWSLSPGLDYDGSVGDKKSALAKFKSVQALGVQYFALLMDDIDVAADVTSAAAHVDLVNYLQDELRKVDADTYFLFVPTVYRGHPELLSPGQRRYLETLANLRPDIYVMWTGLDVFAPTMDLADMQPIAALVGRPLVIWDNYPVADFFFGRRLNLGAVEGRAPDLAAVTGGTQPVIGLLANPLWMPAANRLPLATILDYLADPSDYRPARSLAAQVEREVPPEIRETFQTWLASFETFHEVGLDQSAATRAVSEATAAIEAGRMPGAEFANHAAALYVMAPALKRLYHPDLAGELLPAAVAAAHLGEAELLAMQIARLETAQHDASELLDLAAKALAQAEAAKWTVTEGKDAAFLERFLGSPTSWKVAGPSLSTPALPRTVELGDEVRARFEAGDATNVTLHGLPGASFENGVLRWRPGRTGTERWVVVAANENGAAVDFGEIRVVEQKAEGDSGCASVPAGTLATWLLILWIGARKYWPTTSRQT